MNIQHLRSRPGPTLLPLPGQQHVCATYARYSDAELQKLNSIDQQVGGNRDAAAKDGGVIPEHNVFGDPGFLGSEENRPGLNRLMEVIRTGQNDFSHLYIYETSRLARDRAHAATLMKFFDFYEIIVHFVTNGMVSGTPGFNLQHAVFSANDQQFSATLGANVQRGHRTQFKSGFVPYGRVYGYRNVPVIDPAYVESYNQKLRHRGVIHEINETEKEVLLLMKDLRLRDGLGYQAIVRHLNEREIRSPRKPTKNPGRSWGVTTVRNMLTNPRYTGLIRHGVIKTVKNPETKRFEHRLHPEEDVLTYRNEALRIFTDEEHSALVSLYKSRKSKADSRRAGGFGRTSQSRKYLFSGIMKCDLCSHAISICYKDTYMCSNSWKGNGCTNKLKLNRLSLEQHIIEVLAATVRASATFDWLKARLISEIQKQDEEALLERARTASRAKSAEDELRRINREVDTLTIAIKRHGFSEALSDALREAETEKALVMESLNQKAKPRLKMTEDEVIEAIGDALRRLDEILRDDPIKTRDELSKRIDGLRLEPITLDGGPAYRIKGDVRLFGGIEPVMLRRSSSISLNHHFLTLGLDGLILKLEKYGLVLRAVRPPVRLHTISEKPEVLLLAA